MIKKLIIIFILSFALRLLIYNLICYFQLPTILTLEETHRYLAMDKPPAKIQLMDASEYYYNSINLEVDKISADYWGYSHWWERNPLHTLILYLTGNSIMFQIFISALSVMLLFHLNKFAGILLMLYPQNIIYSFLTTKINIMLFLVVVAMVIFKDRKFYLFLSVVVIQMLFISYFNLHPQTTGIMEELNRGLINKITMLWQPSFNHTHIVLGTNLIQYIQSPFYIFLIIYFIRKVGITNPVLYVVIFLTIGAGIQYAHEMHREFIIPLLLNFKNYQ